MHVQQRTVLRGW